MDIEPFVVPSVVTVIHFVKDHDDNFGASDPSYVKQSNTFPLTVLDYEGLDKLCTDFRREVFKKAKVPDCHPDNLRKRQADDNGYGK